MTHKKTCLKCSLSKDCHAGFNNIAGWGNPDAKLVILLDAPGDILAEKLLVWLLMRLSLTSEDIWVDYLVKCELTESKPKKADVLLAYKTCWQHIPRTQVTTTDNVVVICGNWGSKLVAGQEMKNIHGRKDEETGAWICYSFNYLLMQPSVCLETSRVLWKAAEEAGLHPMTNTKLEMFKFPTKKMMV